jgi:bacterioferritin-associated ferredoxin
MHVDRCICHAVTFAELKEISDRDGLDFAGLRARTGCCRGCGLCEPYIRLMLCTGRTSFPVLSPQEIARIMAEALKPPDR